jgi:MFS family permease
MTCKAYSLRSLLFGLPAGAYGVPQKQMMKQFHVHQAPDGFPKLYWATCSWNVGSAVVPLLTVPFTETTGRMPGYFFAYFVFLIFLVPQGVASHIATMIVCRFFGGGASSTAINIVGGTISDIWMGPVQRSLPMSLFGFTSVIGIALGPFLGGAVTVQWHPSLHVLNYHWIYWVLLISCGGLLPVFYLILDETRSDVILAREAKKYRKEHPDDPKFAPSEINRPSLFLRLKISVVRPCKMLAKEWVVFSQTFWVSFAWGILFIFTSSIPQTFTKTYDFKVFATTLAQLAISAGALVAVCLHPIQDKAYADSAKRSPDGKPIPEARLYFSIPASFLFTGGLFWYGWGLYRDVHWMVPIVGIGFVGFGIYGIYVATTNYLIDSYEKYAASALAAASLGRNTFGAFLPLGSPQMYKTFNFHWASSFLGFIGLILSFAPIYLLIKGPEIRQKSPFMKEASFSGAGEQPTMTVGEDIDPGTLEAEDMAAQRAKETEMERQCRDKHLADLHNQGISNRDREAEQHCRELREWQERKDRGEAGDDEKPQDDLEHREDAEHRDTNW